MQRGCSPLVQGVHAPRLAQVTRPEHPVRVGDLFSIAIEFAGTDVCEGEVVSLTLDEPNGKRRVIRQALSREPVTIELTAPGSPGAHTWRLDLAACSQDGLAPSTSPLTLTIDVEPHSASIAVWSLPDTAIIGQPFTAKVGASSTAGRAIAGQTIVVRDDAGTIAGRARFGTEPWPGTEGLHWTEIRLAAPERPGVADWTASLEEEHLGLPHDVTACRFTVPVNSAPKHCVTVMVVDTKTGTPLDEAIVRIGAFRSTTDANGRTSLQVPAGPADIIVWKAGYAVPDVALDVQDDETVSIEATAEPEDDPDARWRA